MTLEAVSKPEGLSLKNVVKRFGGGKRGDVVAVDDVSLEIPPGTFVTLLGPSGCGKTTTLRMIAGFETPTSGSIYLGERCINDIPPNLRDMAMVFQSYALFPHMTVFENVAYGLRVRKVQQSAIKSEVASVLELVNLERVEDRYPNQLSGGQQQRVALARAMVIHPKLLLFDEPLSNLDAKLRVQTRDEIRRLQRRLGITSVYVTHDQSEAMTLSDIIVVMRNGKVEQVGTPEDVYSRPASLFVADFIGEANFIESRIVEVKGEVAMMDLWGVPTPVEGVGRRVKLDGATDVYLVIRPEAVELVSDLSGIVGRVQKATYAGSSMLYSVDVNGSTLSVTDNSPVRPRTYAEGDEVGVRFLNECFHVLPKTS